MPKLKLKKHLQSLSKEQVVDPDTCPYGELCDCGIGEENQDESEDDHPVPDDSDEPFVLPF